MNALRNQSLPIVLAAWIGGAAVGATVAEPSAPMTLVHAVPDDALVVYWLVTPARNQASSTVSPTLSFAGMVVDQARDWGLLSGLDESTRIRLDVFSAIPLIHEFDYALMLFDIQATPRGGDSHKLKALQAALVLLTKGDNARIEHRIQHLLKTYTNSEDSTLESKPVRDGVVYMLRDRRADDWVELGWGRMGDYYLVTIGRGAMNHLVETLEGYGSRLADDAWFRDGFGNLDGDDSTFGLHLRFDRLPGDDDEALARKVERTAGELGVVHANRGLWTLVQRDRAIIARGLLRREGRDELQQITGGEASEDAVARVVPPQAGWYAVIRIEPAQFLRGVATTYVAARSPARRAKLLERWRIMEDKAGVNVSRDLLSRLRSPMISHGFPKHAFGLPLAWTRVIPIDGDPTTFRRDLDKIMQAAADLMPTDEVSRLRYDDDGVWYLHFGLEGPALAVVDHYLVISFSPTALRQNMKFLTAQSATRR